MNIYIVKAAKCGYDEFESVVVVADDKEQAIEIATHAKEKIHFNDGSVEVLGAYFRGDQYPLIATEVDLNEEGIIHESFNAG